MATHIRKAKRARAALPTSHPSLSLNALRLHLSFPQTIREFFILFYFFSYAIYIIYSRLTRFGGHP
jgi:hypothetical protein